MLKKESIMWVAIKSNSLIELPCNFKAWNYTNLLICETNNTMNILWSVHTLRNWVPSVQNSSQKDMNEETDAGLNPILQKLVKWMDFTGNNHILRDTAYSVIESVL